MSNSAATAARRDDGSLMPSVETQFPATAETPQSARAFLRPHCRLWRLDGFGQVTEPTDELVANVVRHVGSPLTLRATRRGDPAHRGRRPEHRAARVAAPRCARRPWSRNPPRRRARDEWGAEIHSDGKTVWFEIDVSTATEDIHGSD
jgi:hypothetical protein